MIPTSLSTANEVLPAALRDRWLVLAGSAVFALALLGLVFLLLHGSHQKLQAIDRVDAQELPKPDPSRLNPSAWQPIQLPAKLCIEDCRFSFKAYRHVVSLPDNDQPMIYLPGFDGAAAVYLNGRLIDQSGSLADPVADTNYQPQAYRLPPSAWRDGTNELLVVVSSVLPRGGRLAPFVVGSTGTIQPAYLPARILTVSVLPFLIGALAILGCCAMLLYFAGDRDRIYLWFTLLTLLCSARLMLVTSPEWPADPLWRHCQYLIATSGVLVASAGFFSRLLGRAASRWDLALILLWLCASVAVVIAMRQDMSSAWLFANQAIGYTGIGVSVFVLSRFVILGHVLSLRQQAALLMLLLLGIGLLLHDVWFVLNRQLLLFQLSNLATAPLIAAFCLALTHRYGSHVRGVLSANETLQQAVAETRQELAHSYERLRAIDQERTLADERNRLLQDMHDGVAGKLAVLTQRLQAPGYNPEQTGRDIEESLIDLRLIIDSLDSSDATDLSFALGNLRVRTEPWLKRNNIRSSWRVAAAEPLAASQSLCLNACRIVQEALNNVLRHSSASSVTIEMSTNELSVEILVADNGIGIKEVALQAPGRGMSIMAKRAADIGAALTVRTPAHGSGTEVRLTIPVSVLAANIKQASTPDDQTP